MTLILTSLIVFSLKLHKVEIKPAREMTVINTGCAGLSAVSGPVAAIILMLLLLLGCCDADNRE